MSSVNTTTFYATLSADGRDVLCGACGGRIASVAVHGRKRDYRELWLPPGSRSAHRGLQPLLGRTSGRPRERRHQRL